MKVQKEKDGWIFGIEKRTADKSFQLTMKDILNVHIEAKWTTLRDWMEATYTLNEKFLGSSKFSTITYAISSIEKRDFLENLKRTLDIKNNSNRFFNFKKNYWGDLLYIDIGLIEAYIPIEGENYNKKEFKYRVIFKGLPSQNGWKTNQPSLPNLDLSQKSEAYSSLKKAKEACIDYLNFLLDTK